MALTGGDGAGAHLWACSGRVKKRREGWPWLGSSGPRPLFGSSRARDLERGINIFISISYVLPRSPIGSRCSISVQRARDALGVAFGIEQRLPGGFRGAGGKADGRSVAERRADVREVNLLRRRSGSRSLRGGPERVGPGDGGADRRDAAGRRTPERRTALEAMLKPLVERALRICREAREAGSRSDDAAERFVSAELEGGYWLSRSRTRPTIGRWNSAWRLSRPMRRLRRPSARSERLGSRCAGRLGVRSMFGRSGGAFLRRRAASLRRL